MLGTGASQSFSRRDWCVAVLFGSLSVEGDSVVWRTGTRLRMARGSTQGGTWHPPCALAPPGNGAGTNHDANNTR